GRRLFRRHPEREDPQGYARPWVAYRDHKGRTLRTEQVQDALKELLKKKQEGKPIERPERPKPTNVVNLMDALRQSVEASDAATSSKGKPRAASPRSSAENTEHPKPKRTRRSG